MTGKMPCPSGFDYIPCEEVRLRYYGPRKLCTIFRQVSENLTLRGSPCCGQGYHIFIKFQSDTVPSPSGTLIANKTLIGNCFRRADRRGEHGNARWPLVQWPTFITICAG